jgi:hypothetical protein
MKRQQKFIPTLSLIVALSGLSPVVAADAGRTSDGVRSQPEDHRQLSSPVGYKLSPEQMDNVHAGMLTLGDIGKERLIMDVGLSFEASLAAFMSAFLEYRTR